MHIPIGPTDQVGRQNGEKEITWPASPSSSSLAFEFMALTEAEADGEESRGINNCSFVPPFLPLPFES